MVFILEQVLDFSNNQGNNWKKIESELVGNSVVTGLGFNQNNELFAFVMPNTEGESNQNGYIIKSDKAVKIGQRQMVKFQMSKQHGSLHWDKIMKFIP